MAQGIDYRLVAGLDDKYRRGFAGAQALDLNTQKIQGMRDEAAQKAKTRAILSKLFPPGGAAGAQAPPQPPAAQPGSVYGQVGAQAAPPPLQHPVGMPTPTQPPLAPQGASPQQVQPFPAPSAPQPQPQPGAQAGGQNTEATNIARLREAGNRISQSGDTEEGSKYLKQAAEKSKAYAQKIWTLGNHIAKNGTPEDLHKYWRDIGDDPIVGPVMKYMTGWENKDGVLDVTMKGIGLEAGQELPGTSFVAPTKGTVGYKRREENLVYKGHRSS